MTKEQRTERKKLNHRLNTVRAERGRMALRAMRAKATLDKQHAKAVRALARELNKQRKAVEKELRLETRIADNEELAILNRLAVVEGRLQS